MFGQQLEDCSELLGSTATIMPLLGKALPGHLKGMDTASVMIPFGTPAAPSEITGLTVIAPEVQPDEEKERAQLVC